jgi:hypothetical protein
MRLACVATIISAVLQAQSLGNGPGHVGSSAIDVQVSIAPPFTAATYINQTVDASVNGNDIIDVVSSNSQVLISLILPTGVEVTPANAGGLGFVVSQPINLASTPATSGLFTPLDSIGAHTTFSLPAGSPGGVYQVKANSANISTATNITVNYFSLSGPTVGLAMSQTAYNPGQNAVLTAFVFGGLTPITGATVTATILPPLALNSQCLLGGFQLVSQTVNGDYTQYTYQGTLTNNGNSALPYALAKLTDVPISLSVIGGPQLGFSNTSAGGSSASVNTFTIQAPSSQPFDPTTLSWNIWSTGTPFTASLVDGGQYDYATGDGLYTGVYVPPAIGLYRVMAKITGTFAGSPFSRSAALTFRVVNPLATLAGVADVAIDDDGNGLSDRLVLSAQVNAQSAGSYVFSVGLTASNGNAISGSGSATLAIGAGQIDVSVPARRVLSLGVDGPYEKVNATLAQIPTDGGPISVGRLADAGPTAAYTLASFDRIPLGFSGQNLATGVITGAGPTFDLLNVQIGVNATSSANCQWGAMLTDASGNPIDYESSGGPMTAGANSIGLNFNGIRIASAGPGPYVVTSVTVTCGALHLAQNRLFTISGFTATQFTYVAQTFTLSALGPAPSGTAGSSITVPLQLSSTGAFQGNVVFSVSGLPTGATGSFAVPSIVGSGFTNLAIATPAGLAAGAYPLTIAYSSGSVSLNLSVTLTINVTTVVTPAFSPAAGTYATAQSVTISTTTPGASIRYTTDGSTPTETTGTLYTSPVAVSNSTTINAIAYASGLADSPIALATYTLAAGPAITRVQFAHSYPGNAVAFAGNNIAGDAIVVVASWAGGAPTPPPSLTDTHGNTYAALPPFTSKDGSVSMQIWYALNVAAGANTVTVSTDADDLSVTAFEYSGVAATGALGVTLTADGTALHEGCPVHQSCSGTTTPTSTSFTPNAGSLVMAFLADEGWSDSLTSGSGFTLVQFDSQQIDAQEDNLKTAATPQTAGFILASPSSSWILSVLELKVN